MWVSRVEIRISWWRVSKAAFNSNRTRTAAWWLSRALRSASCTQKRAVSVLWSKHFEVTRKSICSHIFPDIHDNHFPPFWKWNVGLRWRRSFSEFQFPVRSFLISWMDIDKFLISVMTGKVYLDIVWEAMWVRDLDCMIWMVNPCWSSSLSAQTQREIRTEWIYKMWRR